MQAWRGGKVSIWILCVHFCRNARRRPQANHKPTIQFHSWFPHWCLVKLGVRTFWVASQLPDPWGGRLLCGSQADTHKSTLGHELQKPGLDNVTGLFSWLAYDSLAIPTWSGVLGCSTGW